MYPIIETIPICHLTLKHEWEIGTFELFYIRHDIGYIKVRNLNDKNTELIDSSYWTKPLGFYYE